MTACAERRPEGPGRPNSAPEVGHLVRMANQAKGQARDFAFLASGKLCSTLQKQFSICVIFIWNKSFFLIANIEQLPMPSKLPMPSQEVFVLHPSQNNPDSCQALLNFIEC